MLIEGGGHIPEMIRVDYKALGVMFPPDLGHIHCLQKVNRLMFVSSVHESILYHQLLSRYSMAVAGELHPVFAALINYETRRLNFIPKTEDAISTRHECLTQF